MRHSSRDSEAHEEAVRALYRQRAARKWTGPQRKRPDSKLPPTRHQIRRMRKLEAQLGLRRRWVWSKAEATTYLRELRRERAWRAAAEERARNPDQWSLPAGDCQLYELRRYGIEFTEPLTRREAQDLIDNARRPRP